MSRADAPAGLDLPEGPENRVFELWLHRIGWSSIGLVLLAAAAGLMGPGPLSSRTANAGPSLKIEYDRFTRWHSPATLRVTVARSAAAGQVRLNLNRAFLEAIELQSVTPEPARVELAPGGQTYVFDAPRLAGGDAEIVFHYRADRTLRNLGGVIGVDGGPRLAFSQFVYP
jgi:hypothetical protein